MVSSWQNFIAVIGRILTEEYAIKELLLHFGLANTDKSAKGTVDDIKEFFRGNLIPMPVISDNCSVMVATENYAQGNFFKIYCIEHKLSTIESKLHKNEFFSEIDQQLTSINSFFNYRHEKFDLPRKPLRNYSTTRPWRSNKLNYEVFVANYSRYTQLSNEIKGFPAVPNIHVVSALLEFSKNYCKSFDTLENKDSNLATALIVYFNLVTLSRNPAYLSLNLEKYLINDLYPIVFSKISCAFIVLEKLNLKSNYIK